MALDPFPDPLDSLGLGLRRLRPPAAYPPLPEEEADTLASSLTGAGLSGLGYVGSTLDKLLGGRAVRGVLGGNLREALSVLPGSDVVGLTDPGQATSGEDLLRKVGLDPARSDWWAVRHLAGPALELGLDPSTYFGAAVPKALLRGAKGVNAAARTLPAAGAPLAAAEDALGRLGQVGKVHARSLFDWKAGPVPQADVQLAHETAKVPVREAALVEARRREFDWRERQLQPILDAGVDPEEAARYLRLRSELSPTSSPLHTQLATDPAAYLADVAARKGEVVGPHLPDPLESHLPALADLADRLKEVGPETLAAERRLGVATGDLSDPFAAYGLRQAIGTPGVPKDPRRPFGTRGASQKKREGFLRGIPGGTVQLEDWFRDPSLRGLEQPDRAQQILSDIVERQLGAGTGGVPLAPDLLEGFEKKAGRLARYIGRRDPGPLFSRDVVGDAFDRLRRGAESTSSAETIHTLIGNAARAGAAGTPVVKVLRDAGLVGPEARARALEKLGQDPAALLAAAGPDAEAMQVLGKALAKYAVPTPAAEGATRLIKRFQASSEVGPVLSAYDRGLDLLRTGLYTIWPASHVRNLLSGKFENALEGTGPFASANRDAARVLAGEGVDTGLAAGKSLADQRLDLLQEAYARGVLKPHQGLAERTGTLDEFTSGWVAEPRVGGANLLQDLATLAREGVPRSRAAANPLSPDTFAPSVAGRKVSQNIEDRLRLGQYLDLRRKGLSEADAAAKVEATHFDYSRLADFEKKVAKRVFPFYTYARRNIEKQARRAADEPIKLLGPLRASGATSDREDAYVPQYLRSGVAIPLGAEEGGVQRLLTGLGLPFEEALDRLKVGAGPRDTVGRTLEGLVGNATPALRLPYELASGRQAHTGRSFNDLPPARSIAALGLPTPVARTLSELVANSPASRAVSTLDRLTDTRKGAPLQALNVLTGLRVSDVDVDKYRSLDARDALNALLAGDDRVSRYERLYVRPEDRAKVDPELERLLGLQAALSLRAKEAAARRRQQPPG